MKDNRDLFDSITLWEHQTNFINQYYEEPKIKKWQLNWTTGTGKTFVISALISNEYLYNNKNDILILSGRNFLIAEWKRMINRIDETLNPIILDRKLFMKYQFNNTWPSGIIIINSNLLNFNDFYESIKQKKWDIIVLDDTPIVDANLKENIIRIINNKKTGKSIIICQNKSYGFIEKTKIHTYDITNKFKLSIANINIIEYKRMPEEINILNMIEEMAKKIQISEIENIAYSSFFALNIHLKYMLKDIQYMRNKIAHSMDITKKDTIKIYKTLYGDKEFDNDAVLNMGFNDVFELLASINVIIEMIDEMPQDNKLLTLIDNIESKHNNKKKNVKHIIVWTSYEDTGEYIYNNLLDLDIPVYILKENESDGKRYLDYNTYKKLGGVLVLIGRGITGTRLDYIDECINYDVKLDSMELRDRYSRLVNINKETMFSLLTPNNPLEKDLSRLRQLS